MKKAIKLNESDIRSLINEILSEDLMPPGFHPSVGDRPIAAPKPKSGLPNLKAFKKHERSIAMDRSGHPVCYICEKRTR